MLSLYKQQCKDYCIPVLLKIRDNTHYVLQIMSQKTIYVINRETLQFFFNIETGCILPFYQYFILNALSLKIV